jgi:hypothetical protein
MKITTSLLFSTSFLVATVLAAPLASNAATAVSHNKDNAGNADLVNNINFWKKEKRAPHAVETEGNADQIDDLTRWGFGIEKRDASPHGTADETLASGNADTEFNSYGWTR